MLFKFALTLPCDWPSGSIHSKHPWFSGLRQHFLMPVQSVSTLHSHRLPSTVLTITTVLGHHPGFHPGSHKTLWQPAEIKTIEKMLEVSQMGVGVGGLRNLLPWQSFSSSGRRWEWPDFSVYTLSMSIICRVHFPNRTNILSFGTSWKGLWRYHHPPACCFHCWLYQPINSSNDIHLHLLYNN